MEKKKACSCLLLLLLMVGSPGFAAGGDHEAEVDSSFQFFLGPGDVLEISVWKNEDLTKQVVIRPDGRISFPLIGDVVAEGHTVEELREALRKKIETYVPDAPVAVMLLQVTSPKVYVVGKVAKPGIYVMEEPMRVMQVLAMAGGMTPFADKDQILIIRKSKVRQETSQFNYSQVARGKDLEQNIFLKPGDTVVVP